MDHFSKVLEQSQPEGSSVKSWVQPDRSHRRRQPVVPARRVERLDPQHLRAHRIVCGPGAQDPVIADKYRLLRTQLFHRMKGAGWTRLAVTSPGPKAGKTLTSINLAMSFAWDTQQPVVLIDADLRKPTVASDLGIEVSQGLVDYLAGDAELADVAIALEEVPNLTVIPGRLPEDRKGAPELLRSERMRGLWDQLERGDAVVLVDLPPVLVGDDVIQIASHVHGLLLVVEERGTELEDLNEARDLLAEFNVLGAVLNKSSEDRGGYAGYYYGAAQPVDQPGSR